MLKYSALHIINNLCSNCCISLFLIFSGDTLEIGAQWAIAKKDVDEFGRYMAQLKCYYLDYK